MTTQRLPRTHMTRFRQSDRINLLALAVGAVAALYILTGAFVAAVLLPLLAGLGAEGVLRGHPAARLRESGDAAAQAALPAGFALALALFWRYVATGYWGVPAALLTTLLFGALVYAQYAALDTDGAARDTARVAQLAAAHAGLFATLSVLYAYDLSAIAAALLAGATACLFALVPLRQSELNWSATIVYALAAGFALAQVRFALTYARLDGLIAALFLTLAFYGGLGLTTAAIEGRLDRRVWLEYTLVLVVGVAIVAAGQAIV